MWNENDNAARNGYSERFIRANIPPPAWRADDGSMSLKSAMGFMNVYPYGSAGTAHPTAAVVLLFDSLWLH